MKEGGSSISTAALVALLAVLAASLQGCEVPGFGTYLRAAKANGAGSRSLTGMAPKMPPPNAQQLQALAKMQMPAWRRELEYFGKLAYADPKTKKPTFNSCNDPSLKTEQICSGRGHCKAFDLMISKTPTFFCKCNEDWGGPECNLKRKSQATAWILSMVGGPLGLDMAYLGLTKLMLMKQFLTLVGVIMVLIEYETVALWLVAAPWVFDIIKLGSTPMEAAGWRCANDLPRWVFVFFTILFLSFGAITMGLVEITRSIKRKRINWDKGVNYSSAKAAALPLA